MDSFIPFMLLLIMLVFSFHSFLIHVLGHRSDVDVWKTVYNMTYNQMVGRLCMIEQ